ncbi:Zinc finger protein ZIC 4 [Fusarium austroafricanum]|uniref:Zinc finger protein ZIC 4 n=1 Tax=Fusarium austroafricanum TaxID=2364996 RepID=A0A8H4P6Q3_9HYPO|nr:Zinc finger protein ZIC 4 [Fusarium austroafricanum]
MAFYSHNHSQLSADQLRHSDSDSDSRYHHAWAGSGSSSYYNEPTTSDPRYHAFGNYYASQSNSNYSYRPGDYSESQQDDHQHMWQSQDHSGAPPSSSSVATSSPPNLQDDSYGYMNPDANGDQNRCQCGKAFRRPSDLAKHQKYHIKYFSCLFSGCDKAFATQKDLTRHMRTHRKGEGYQCKVDGCRKAMSGHVYSRKDNFDRHMRTAHPDHPQI